MFCLSTPARLISAAIVAFGLAGCASDPDASSDEEGTAEVSSTLPIAPLGAFSEANASFAGLGLGTTAAVGSVGATTVGGTTVGVGGTTFGTGPTGFSTGFNTGPITTGFNTGPITTGFNTGPITMGFNSGPMTMSTGNTTSISSGSNGVPVITNTCTGFGCP